MLRPRATALKLSIIDFPHDCIIFWAFASGATGRCEEFGVLARGASNCGITGYQRILIDGIWWAFGMELYSMWLSARMGMMPSDVAIRDAMKLQLKC
jgi:hypothetical protein